MPSDPAALPFMCLEFNMSQCFYITQNLKMVELENTLENIYANIPESREYKELAHGHKAAESETEPDLLAPEPD